MLHYLPRMEVTHTSDQRGQVYLPVLNYIQLFFTIIAVLIFKNSENLASAYGLSVASVMLISTIFVSLLADYQWQWSKLKLLLIMGPL